MNCHLDGTRHFVQLAPERKDDSEHSNNSISTFHKLKALTKCCIGLEVLNKFPDSINVPLVSAQ